MRTRERSRRLMPTYKAHRTPNCIHLFTCQKISDLPPPHRPSPHATRTYPHYVSRRTADMVARIERNLEWCARGVGAGVFGGTECALHPIITSITLCANTVVLWLCAHCAHDASCSDTTCSIAVRHPILNISFYSFAFFSSTRSRRSEIVSIILCSLSLDRQIYVCTFSGTRCRTSSALAGTHNFRI